MNSSFIVCVTYGKKHKRNAFFREYKRPSYYYSNYYRLKMCGIHICRRVSIIKCLQIRSPIVSALVYKIRWNSARRRKKKLYTKRENEYRDEIEEKKNQL